MQPDTVIPDQINPQSWNRFSYVLNSPIIFNDPTGHQYCGPDNIYCGGLSDSYTSAKVPSPSSPPDDLDEGLKQKKAKNKEVCGQSGVYSSRCPGWHFYTAGPTLVCPAEFYCSEQEMIDYLSRFAYPGQYPSNPVHNTDINQVGLGSFCTGSLCLGPYSMGPLGEIQTFISDGGSTIKNVTQKGHIFYAGIIIRKVYQEEDGAWYVRTYGYGNNVYPGMDKTNQGFGPDIFDVMDENMKNMIAAHH